ncbi:hypothetical protein PHLGIDRAFT_29899 [Phlebiopsis gigantea 11061_1 CR5-6]|uniref:CCD97-like C-terminal domain-containing protein n=1 Tax=Phlebiopsis gigantea (strain 11061_1 CR5-6) TaxID=745531 RepID=A0A0C3S8U4_PHLG1|nr:hypothetical protein PHLGIDRAFT_29899 [Phlebiopsis gigantea 11061_1 CR5-6]
MSGGSEDLQPYVLVVLKYLGLPQDYEPSPVAAPIEFLSRHMRSLPRNLLSLFSTHVTPKERTVLPAIRNRRLRYLESEPPEFRVPIAKATFSSLWPGTIGPELGREEAKEEREWANKQFMGGQGKQVGKLGELLGGYQEEREAERARDLRRQQREEEEAYPEEDEDTDEEEAAVAAAQEELSPQEAEGLFKRRLKERYIYGLLKTVNYDQVDWDDKWDSDGRDEEERWFDEEEEGPAVNA